MCAHSIFIFYFLSLEGDSAQSWKVATQYADRSERILDKAWP